MGLSRTLLFFMLAVQIVPAGTIYESAPLSSLLWEQGTSVLPVQFLGARFVLQNSTHITGLGAAVGTHVNGPQAFFAALLKLPDTTALPSSKAGVPFEVTPFWTDEFTLSSQGEDVRLHTSLYVSPGAYALVVGSGLFGAANGDGYLPSASGVPATDMIGWYDSTGAAPQEFRNATWHELTDRASRFVVEGTVVPEPGSVGLMGAALLLLLALSRRTKDQARVLSGK